MWRIILLSLCAAILFVSCDEEDPKPVEPTPAIQAVSAPSFLLCNAESLYTFSVRIESFEPDSVICLVTRPDGSAELPFRLYDDAGALPHSSPAYASEHSGDVVANNGTFTRKIWSNLLCNGEQGEYTFQFEAIKGAAHLVDHSFVVEVRAPVACDITTGVLPTAFEACFDPTTLSITIVEDPDVPIDTVKVQWISGDTLWWEEDMSRTNNDEWQFPLAPSVFQCTPSGSNYVLRFDAYNAFGLSCSREVNGLSFENGLPVLSNPQLADTLYRPVTVGDSVTLQFFIRSDDCELVGTAWTQAVFFEVSRDDTMNWTTRNDFFLRDDGVPPDVTRGDGLASSYLVVSNRGDGLVNNLYYLKFYSIECASGDTSVALIDSTRIILPGTLIGGGDNRNSSDLGLSSFK